VARNEGQALLDWKAFDENPEEFRLAQQTPDVGDLWTQRDSWCAWLLERGCDPGYSKTATTYLDWWKQVLRGKPIAGFALAELQAKLKSISAVPNRIKALKSFTKYLRQSGLLHHHQDPTISLPVPQAKSNKDPNAAHRAVRRLHAHGIAVDLTWAPPPATVFSLASWKSEVACYCSSGERRSWPRRQC
jgi:hypothetical protein